MSFSNFSFPYHHSTNHRYKKQDRGKFKRKQVLAEKQFPKTFDPTIVDLNPKRDRYFFYQLDSSGSFYFLRSVGLDGIPFTADDIVPTIPEDERKKTGPRLKRYLSNRCESSRTRAQGDQLLYWCCFGRHCDGAPVVCRMVEPGFAER